MTVGLSFFLDVVRLGAALVVLFCHGPKPQFIQDAIAPFRFEHDAVLIFFVLSGYLISAASSREKSARSFFLARASRVLSVSVPAIALTVLLVAAGQMMGFSQYAGVTPTSLLGWSAASLTFINQVWFLAVETPSQTPYWSLSYEVAYYGIFGAVLFGRGALRIVLPMAVAVIVGPKILMLMPTWLLGCLIYRVHLQWHPSRTVAPAIFLGSICAYAALKAFVGHAPLYDTNPWLGHGLSDQIWTSWHLDMHFSLLFGWDYIVSLDFGCMLLAAPSLVVAVPMWLARAARAGAGVSFSLYLFQRPLLWFTGGFLPAGTRYLLPFYAINLGLIVALAQITEKRRKAVAGLLESLISGAVARLR